VPKIKAMLYFWFINYFSWSGQRQGLCQSVYEVQKRLKDKSTRKNSSGSYALLPTKHIFAEPSDRHQFHLQDNARNARLRCHTEWTCKLNSFIKTSLVKNQSTPFFGVRVVSACFGVTDGREGVVFKAGARFGTIVYSLISEPSPPRAHSGSPRQCGPTRASRQPHQGTECCYTRPSTAGTYTEKITNDTFMANIIFSRYNYLQNAPTSSTRANPHGYQNRSLLSSSSLGPRLTTKLSKINTTYFSWFIKLIQISGSRWQPAGSKGPPDPL